KELSETVIDCAIEVHRTLGAGLLENTYEKCLAYELSMKDIPFILQALIPIQYKDIKLECGYRLDFLVDDCLILELKSVEKLLKIHKAQILTYLKLTHISTGLLINFNTSRLVNGIKRYKR
ncbi:MAG: GxxExxY protein, partial [Candidatus Polarisedimenticolaceae bacterium]|nr:GxxExxY protein [Candidatus Polarisedimenticolaceae bacterium]